MALDYAYDKRLRRAALLRIIHTEFTHFRTDFWYTLEYGERFVSRLSSGLVMDRVQENASILMPAHYSLRQNALLGALSEYEYRRLAPHLEMVELSLGECLYESGSPITHIHFPIDCIVSLLHLMENGAATEIAMIGKEGMVGIAALLGGGSTSSRAVVQSAGRSYRLKARVLKTEFEENPDLQQRLLSFTQALLTQMSQTAVCNRHHSLGQQLSRWLLFSLDRLECNSLDMTQELIANALGVRREGVTEAARKLQAKEIIQYQRGHITVLDRVRLEAEACECYKVVKMEYDRLLAANPDD